MTSEFEGIHIANRGWYRDKKETTPPISVICKTYCWAVTETDNRDYFDYRCATSLLCGIVLDLRPNR